MMGLGPEDEEDSSDDEAEKGKPKSPKKEVIKRYGNQKVRPTHHI